MIKPFSQRIGVEPVKTALQLESMNAELRNAIWNLLAVYCWRPASEVVRVAQNGNLERKGDGFFEVVWAFFLKRPIDNRPKDQGSTLSELRQLYFDWPWHRVYDFLEFTAEHFQWSPGGGQDFQRHCNTALTLELSGYRFVDGLITPVTSEEELGSVETAISNADVFAPARDHLRQALSLFSDRKAPDYRNSIKESISAVEAACRKISGNDKATLGDALKELEKGHDLHKALKSAFSSLYGFTSDSNGIRHALLDESTLDFHDAKFMLVACSAFVNFLVAKTAQ